MVPCLMTMRSEDNVPGDELGESVILLVEDSEEDILLLKRAFRNARIANSLNVVKDGEQAIQYLSGNGPHADRDRYPLPFQIGRAHV